MPLGILDQYTVRTAQLGQVESLFVHLNPFTLEVERRDKCVEQKGRSERRDRDRGQHRGCARLDGRLQMAGQCA